MAQPQIPAPEYPQPAEVPAEKRLAPTPERSGFFVPDEINGTDPVSDHFMRDQERCEAVNHGYTDFVGCFGDPLPPFSNIQD